MSPEGVYVSDWQLWLYAYGPHIALAVVAAVLCHLAFYFLSKPPKMPEKKAWPTKRIVVDDGATKRLNANTSLLAPLKPGAVIPERYPGEVVVNYAQVMRNPIAPSYGMLTSALPMNTMFMCTASALSAGGLATYDEDAYNRLLAQAQQQQNAGMANYGAQQSSLQKALGL